MISATDVSVGYDDTLVIDGVGLRAGPGEVVGLIGPNGSGKPDRRAGNAGPGLRRGRRRCRPARSASAEGRVTRACRAGAWASVDHRVAVFLQAVAVHRSVGGQDAG